jgi:hypothetical protein
MIATEQQPRGRPLGPPKKRVNVTLEPHVLDAVRALAAQERREFSAQVQLMLERQLDVERQ